ncbi:MAG TPA: mycofactocin-coupled SDR family oxidoreductase [Amycolatopsis sp.]|uniref:mycofactocin-coupled SDR family oxidoreductase n=1 Tax=Amycolatopsis sp. TaxID=37632 RepID=UPI002B4761C8|nr:mycofactocin-coupled SDR family oxidoreductase [Amycolatopsis sp.]HKS47019.1 mycofactocin-coupled SDR family oxidoreductase [Amycolatopsis sp.]
MGRLEGRVAFITGAARGQGRSHALHLAAEGADIIAVDICEQIETVPFPMATPGDLAETVKAVEALDRRIIATKADVRDYEALKAAVDDGVAALGRLDIVLANAGMGGAFGHAEDLSHEGWRDTIDVNLTGVWHTAKVAIPHLRAGGRGGSIVITSSGAALAGAQNMAHYVAAKTGNVGLMKALAAELAPEMIRVNAICPSTVDTTMVRNDAMYRLFRPDLRSPGLDDVIDGYRSINAMPVPWIEVEDVSNAVLFLVSDEGRYITGVALPVDAGFLLR